MSLTPEQHEAIGIPSDEFYAMPLDERQAAVAGSPILPKAETVSLTDEQYAELGITEQDLAVMNVYERLSFLDEHGLNEDGRPQERVEIP